MQIEFFNFSIDAFFNQFLILRILLLVLITAYLVCDIIIFRLSSH
jgi:hypothetical protein